MRVIHRITISLSPQVRKELAGMGVLVGASGLASFDLDESHESWSKMQRWIDLRKPLDVVRTQFSKDEIAKAQWLELMPDWHQGFPQPKHDEFGYLEATYDLSGYCPRCGVGLRQKAPFQMEAEPKWGRNGILQLNWIFDEFFVTPAVWARVFEPHGVGSRPVVSTKGTELKTVVQLAPTNEVDVVTHGLAFKTCGSCGVIKYLPTTRGPFPALAGQPLRVNMTKTRQYFGSGAAASKRVLISQNLARALADNNVRGASTKLVAE
jgi:hypothetical protein